MAGGEWGGSAEEASVYYKACWYVYVYISVHVCVHKCTCTSIHTSALRLRTLERDRVIVVAQVEIGGKQTIFLNFFKSDTLDSSTCV